jgi:hypothetical protein
MSDPDSSVVSCKKMKTHFGSYIWNSPCLKPLVFNPFIISILILVVLWVIDYIYGKTFHKRKGGSAISTCAQHLITSYAVIAAGVAMNNIIIKHHYRLDRVTVDDDLQNEPLVEATNNEVNN